MNETTIRTRDGVDLFARTGPRVAGPNAVVAMVHGLGEHSGRYASLHRALSGAGLAWAAADLRGFGRSPGTRGHVDGWADYRSDVAAILELGRAQAPGAPVFLFGHSMGGLIVLDYALREPHGIAGVAASGPALVPAGVRRPVLEVTARVLSLLVPKLSTELGLDPAGLSTDPQVAVDYLADPLVHGKVSMRWGAEIMASMAWVREHPASLRVPLLLQHGGADPINAASGTVAFYEAAGCADKTLRLYEGCRHEVHHDAARETFERDLVQWLLERSGVGV